MRFIGTRSLSCAANDWLRTTRQPRILHIFDHACNLINEHGDVLSIVTPDIGNGPFNLVIEASLHLSERLDVHSPISAREGALVLGDLNINLESARFWNARPAWELLYARRDDIASHPVFSTISEQLAPRYIPNSLLAALSAALVKADTSNAGAIASRLAGLGIGLTPSGDDFLMGALYATWIIHPPGIAERISREIAIAAAPLTTSLSAAWLRAAANGEAGMQWHKLFDALIFGEPSSIRAAVTDMLSIGATSGADALAGFAGTLNCLATLNDQ